MEEQFSRFPYISEQIFDQLDDQNLVKCRRISKSWCNYLDNQKVLYIRMIKQSIKSSDYNKAPSHSANFYADACTNCNPCIAGLKKGLFDDLGTISELLFGTKNQEMQGPQRHQKAPVKPIMETESKVVSKIHEMK